jgi:hypothetical protein
MPSQPVARCAAREGGSGRGRVEIQFRKACAGVIAQATV